MPFSRRVSIKDIAKSAGVSYSTVSRALNDSALISQEVRTRIQSLAQAMGYTPNALAQSLQSHQTQTIGLVITTISDPFFTDVVQGVEEVAREANISVLLATSHNDPEEELRIIENFSRRRVDGVIVAASRIGADYAARLEQIRIPVIMINNQAEGEFQNLYTVSVDDFAGARLAVNHLIQLGHRKIGYLGVASRPGSNERRMRGYRSTMEEHALAVRPEWICIDAAITPAGMPVDIAAGQSLLHKILPSGITAVFCYCDTLAAGVLMACRELEIDVPRQLSVVGYDDSDLCGFVCPPLTTIHQPKQEMGRMAMQMLITSVTGGPINDRLLEPTLIVRESSVAPIKTT